MKGIVLSALTLLASIFTGIAAKAEVKASDAFVNAPKQIFPLLDQSTRMDMIDYFNSGSSTPSRNALDGKSRLTDLSDKSLSIAMTDASAYQLAILPGQGNDMVALISTIVNPAPDSKLTVYTSDWSSNMTSKVFKKPQLSDWLTESGKSEEGQVASLVPFLLISYSYDPASGILTLDNNTKSFLSDDIYSIVSEYLRPQLRFKWDGKKFRPID